MVYRAILECTPDIRDKFLRDSGVKGIYWLRYNHSLKCSLDIAVINDSHFRNKDNVGQNMSEI